VNHTRVRFLVGLVLSAAVWLAMLVLGGSGFAFDSWAAATFGSTDPGTSDLARRLAWLGEWQVLTAAAVLVAVYLAFRRRRRAPLLLITVVGGRLVVEIQKLVVGREQPGVPSFLEAAQSVSFPSVHAANALITWVAIALLLPGRRWVHNLLIAIALLLALGAGWSQLALGNHWGSDVVGGWAFGLFWVIVCLRLATDRPGD
jgi:undecaprenyl-diphosphatase